MNFEEFHLNPEDFIENASKKPIISGSCCVSFGIQKNTQIRCAVKRKNEILNYRNEKSFDHAMEILSRIQYPSIVPFIGFSKENGFGHIYMAEVQNGSLHSFLKNNLKSCELDPNFNNTSKFIISYGIAKSMEYLSNFQIMNRNLNSSNVLLDDKFYPFLTNFYTSPQKFDIKESRFIAPEVNEGPEGCLPEAGVYSYGMLLYELWTEIPPFSHIKSANLVIEAIKNGNFPMIPSFLNENWKKLIEKCLCINPISRPNFNEIVSELETDKYYTDDMDRSAIEEYKKIFSKSSVFMPNFSNNEKPKTEHEKDKENPILIKLKEGASSGDVASQFILAVAQFEGVFGHPDYDESFKYSMMYIKSNDCEKNDIVYKSTMEFYAANSSVHLNNYEIAAKLLRLSNSHGCGESAFLLANLMFENKVKTKNSEEIKYLYRSAADKGIPEAIKKYACMLYNGCFNEKVSMKSNAIRYFEKGSETGDPELMYLWAIRNERLKNKEEAMHLMKLAADLGYAPALVDYGIHLLNGINVDKNVEEAKFRFQSAAAKNDSYGQLWYYLMCKNECDIKIKDDLLDEYLKMSLNSSENPESWSVFGRELVQDGKIEEALPNLYYGAQNGSINALLCLGQICEKDPQFGDAKFYFKLASNYCHCLDFCGFTSPIQYNVYHCDECCIDICEGCAKHCHSNHKSTKIDSKIGLKCQCGKKGFIDKCTCEFVGETCCYQHLYQCETCCQKYDSEYICKSCAEKCHKDHKVVDCGIVKNFCSCGTKKTINKFDCHLLELVKNEENNCSQTKKMQRWFQCVSCGLYGSDDIGVCEVCAHACHDNHIVLDLGVSDKSCKCKYSNCLFNKE